LEPRLNALAGSAGAAGAVDVIGGCAGLLVVDGAVVFAGVAEGVAVSAVGAASHRKTSFAKGPGGV